MTVAEENRSESRPFEADVAKLLQLIVHSVYSEKSIFLRELISNAADACERLRYESIAVPALLGDDPKPRITITVDAEERQLMVEDNGIGMSREELIELLGTIARSGTKAFIDRLEAAKERRRDGVDRPLRRRLLLGLHGGRKGRGVFPARRQRDRACLVVGRQGRVCRGGRRSGLRAAPRHARRAASDGGRQVLYRARDHRAACARAIGPCAGADRDRREAGGGACRNHRRRRALGQAEIFDHARRLYRLLSQHCRPVR